MTDHQETIRGLHVDDDPEFTDLTATMLEESYEQFQVETATSGREGIDRVSSETFDFVVSDYEMPGVDGIEFLKTVRENHPDLPFILFTGKGSESVASDAIAAGATDYLQKTGGVEQYDLLANRVANAVEQYREKQRRERLEGIRTIVNQVNQALVRASTRDWIETQVCEILAAADGYQAGLVVRVDAGSNTVSPQSWAGIDEQPIREWLAASDGMQSGHPPAIEQAIHERDVAVVQDVGTESDGSFHGNADDIRSIAVVPLVFEPELYGLLVVFGTRPQAFDETEQSFLAELGDDIAHAMHAIDVRHELERERKFIDQALDAIEDIFYVIGPDGTLRRWNQQFREVTGYSDEEIAGMSAVEFFPEDERHKVDGAIECTLTQGRQMTEADLLTAEGTRIPYEFVAVKLGDALEGEPGIVGIGRDVTDRQERERTLRRYKQMVNAMQESACIYDEDARFEVVNEYLAEFYGTTREDLEGSPSTLIPQIRDQLGGTPFQDLIDGTREEVRGELEGEFPGQGREVLDYRLTPLVVDGKIDGVVGVTREVTERRDRERELARQNDRLESVANIASHDLRNQLSVARSRLELAAIDDEHADPIRRAHDRMESLLADLLALARRGKRVEDTEHVGLEPIIRESWDHVETPTATLTVTATGTLEADPDRLRRLLEALFENSIEHGGESVTVTAGDLEDGFFIADDGPGIPEDDHERVFDPSYSTAENSTGLGLTIVQAIADAHGWTVEATENADGGARFEITNVESS